MRFFAKASMSICAGALVTACGSVSDVVTVGQDTYMVESHGVVGNGSSSAEKVKAYQAASRYCQSFGRELQPVSTRQVDSGFGKAPAAELTFRCLAKGDPELNRPNLQPGADIVIEQRNR